MVRGTHGYLRAGRLAVVAAAVAGFATMSAAAHAMDEIDDLAQRSNIPPALRQPHPHSDFTDPLGRFLDFLAAGAFADAKALRPEACAEWRAKRQTLALSGKVQIWDAEIDLNALCPDR
jgi:hypothetical protein